MKNKLNKSTVFLASTLMLFACNDDAEDSTNEVEEEVEAASDINFISGVNSENEVYGDSQNYANIVGEAPDASQVSALDAETGILLGMALVEGDNFNLSFNMQGLDETELVFTTDDSIEIPEDLSNTYDLDTIEDGISLYFIPNDNVNGSEGSSNENYEDTETSEETASIPSDLGSRSNPVPFDTSYGIVAEVGTNEIIFDVTVVETIRGEEAWDIVYGENQFNDAPGDGEEYIINKIEIEMLHSDDSDIPTDFSFREFDYFTASGTNYQTHSTLVPNRLEFEIFEGSSAEGYIAQIINEDDTPLIRYGNTFFFETE